MKCQFDAFAGYVADAEKHGPEKYPLYEWTKATIEDPTKKAKYIKSFTLYVDGDEVYAEQQADALESDLQALVASKLVARMSKHDTNPAEQPAATSTLPQVTISGARRLRRRPLEAMVDRSPCLAVAVGTQSGHCWLIPRAVPRMSLMS